MINVKIDTKEKFTVITPTIADISANMTDQLIALLLSYLKKEIPHVVLNMKNIQSINEDSCKKIAVAQLEFYEENKSFVICELQKDVELLLHESELLEVMNVTFTESEAWDMVQMEEIERELLSDVDNDQKEQKQ